MRALSTSSLGRTGGTGGTKSEATTASACPTSASEVGQAGQSADDARTWRVYRSLFPFGVGRTLGEVVAADRAAAIDLARAQFGERIVVDPAPVTKGTSKPTEARRGAR